MTVQAEYWHSGTPSERSWNPITPIAATEERIIFEDSDVTSGYLLKLVVYENGMLNTVMFSDDQAIPITAQQEPADSLPGTYFCTRENAAAYISS